MRHEVGAAMDSSRLHKRRGMNEELESERGSSSRRRDEKGEERNERRTKVCEMKEIARKGDRGARTNEERFEFRGWSCWLEAER